VKEKHDSQPADRRRAGRSAVSDGEPDTAAHPRDVGWWPGLREPPGSRDRREPSSAAHAPATPRGRRPGRRESRALRRRKGDEVLRGRGLRPAPHPIGCGRGGHDLDPIGPGEGSRTQGALVMYLSAETTAATTSTIAWPMVILILGLSLLAFCVFVAVAAVSYTHLRAHE